MMIDKQVNRERENDPNFHLEKNKKIKLGDEMPDISPVKIKIRKSRQGCCDG